jgi:hypothetical protein
MNENLKTKITRRLDEMTDETGRQVLDYMEFLESKYNLSRRAPSTVQKIAEGLEDRIGSVSVTDMATKGAAQMMDAASKMMEGLAAAGRVVSEELTPSDEAAKAGEAAVAGEEAAGEEATVEADQEEEAQKTDA